MDAAATEEFLRSYIDSISILLRRVPMESVLRVVALLEEARRQGRTIFILGNGGSAATASHFATDLGKGTVQDRRPRFRVIALTDNMPLLTAWANDTEYANVFAEQVKSLVQAEDVVIAISGSGRSPNVLRAVEAARALGARTVGFCGFDGGLLKNAVDFPIHIPCDRMDQVEDAHHMLQHAICACVRERSQRNGR